MPRFVALEIPQTFGDVDAAFDRAARAMDAAGRADLVLLPEAIFTGYLSPSGDADLRHFAEPLGGPTCARVAALARDRSTAIAAPLIELANDRHYNSFVVFDRSGELIAHYRKRRPWFVETWATPGDLGTPVFEIGSVTCTIAVCFDIHFAPQDAHDALQTSSVLLFPSAWVDDAGDARPSILTALARDHGVAIVNANWGPSEPRIRGQGGSMIVGKDGRVLARGGTVACDLD